MSDWKGTKVWINVYEDGNLVVNEIDTYLDTDTMSDLFERYPLSEGYSISIMAAPKDEYND